MVPVGDRSHRERWKSMDQFRNIPLIRIALIMFALFTIMSCPSARADEDLIIGDDESIYTVGGEETWADVTILTNGTLFIPEGSILRATTILCEGESVFRISGGSVVLTNDDHAGHVRISGSCSSFILSNDAAILMNGSDGFAQTSSPGPYDEFIPVSMGGDAVIDVSATEMIQI